MKKYIYLFVIIMFFECTVQTEEQDDASSIIELADRYFERTIMTHPEYAYYADIPLESHSQISSNKLSDIKLWESFEDSLYIELTKIDESKLNTKKTKIAYLFLKEDLESSIAMRVCRRNLWNIDPESGWQSLWLAIAQIQPVGSAEFRVQALTRWNNLPLMIETEINNLKLGISKGYTMPKEIVNIVIDQLQVLLDFKIEESPFMLPAKRDGDKKFYSQWEKLISEKILPDVKNYHTFLKNEYLQNARENVSILSQPSGNECYQAYLKKYTASNKTGNEILESGKKIVSINKDKIKELGKELYGTGDFIEIIKTINKDSLNYFTTSDEILETSERLVGKAKEESEKWFTSLPNYEVIIKPYESYETGRGAYEQSSGDKPAYFRINLNNPNDQQKGNNEVLTFHETYPGHHIQIGLEKEIEDLHPIVKLISFTSFVEGWARYSEQLAEEMDLYENKSALITRRAWPSRGMVVDPGIHIKGWSKKQAVDYMVESGMNQETALSLYFRSITMPGQLTSYDVGGEEIKALRKLTEEKLGAKFEIKEFHSKVLENGAIPLGALRIIIEKWIDEKAN
jgi:uncharacterized protein (DUF885 family)